jgi:hypothetical protein
VLPLLPRHLLVELGRARKRIVSNAKVLIAPCKACKPQSWERLHWLVWHGVVHASRMCIRRSSDRLETKEASVTGT